MSVTDCRACGTEISEDEEACPRCGLPMKYQSTQNPEREMNKETRKDQVRKEVQGEIRGNNSMVKCKTCGERISDTANKCPHCGGAQLEKSDGMAALLGFLLGPVGLWYKGNYAAGFAWFVMAIIFGAMTFGLAAPIFWIGMSIHAYVADTKV